jgi:hypothetical protein
VGSIPTGGTISDAFLMDEGSGCLAENLPSGVTIPKLPGR